jgi:hypothetical protein
MRWAAFMLLLILSPARAAGLLVASAGPTTQYRAWGGPGWDHLFAGGELQIDLGHDFRHVRVGGQFRFSGMEGFETSPNPLEFTLTWGPAVEARLGRWVRLGAAFRFGLGIVRYADDCDTCFLVGTVPLIEPSLWLSVDLWHDVHGRAVVLTAEGYFNGWLDTVVRQHFGGGLLAGCRL